MAVLNKTSYGFCVYFTQLTKYIILAFFCNSMVVQNILKLIISACSAIIFQCDVQTKKVHSKENYRKFKK